MHKISGSVKNTAAVSKEKADILKAKTAEKAEKAVAKTKEERHLADEREKMKECEAGMKLHERKAEIIEGKLERKYHHHRPIHPHGHAGTHKAAPGIDPTTTAYPRKSI